MDWNLIISILLTFLTIGVTIFFNLKQYKKTEEQIKNQNNQLKQQFFSEYTKRYQEVLRYLPSKVFNDSFNENDLDDDILKNMRAYFDLCSEEICLHKRKHIDDETWNIWEEGIKNIFEKRAFQLSLEKADKNAKYFKELKALIMNFKKSEGK